MGTMLGKVGPRDLRMYANFSLLTWAASIIYACTGWWRKGEDKDQCQGLRGGERNGKGQEKEYSKLPLIWTPEMRPPLYWGHFKVCYLVQIYSSNETTPLIRILRQVLRVAGLEGEGEENKRERGKKKIISISRYWTKFFANHRTNRPEAGSRNENQAVVIKEDASSEHHTRNARPVQHHTERATKWRCQLSRW